MARAHFVIWNEGDLTVLGDQLERILHHITDRDLMTKVQ